MSSATDRGDSWSSHNSATAVAARASAILIYILLGFVLFDALFEGFGLALAERYGVPQIESLVKAARNLAYASLAVAAVTRIATTTGFRNFVRPVDIAFAVLIGTLLLAGVAGGSSPVLMAHAVFVYVRGALVFYAIRALAPDWVTARPLVLVVATMVLVHIVAAYGQALLGAPMYEALGFTDLTWAEDNRAQGLFNHPNHLGHVTGLAALMLVAVNIPRTSRRWWLVLAAVTVALAFSQSRESLLAFAAGTVVIGLLHRTYAKRIVMVLALLVATTAVVWTVQPGSWDALLQKIRGVGAALDVPSGDSPSVPCNPTEAECTPRGQPSRSIRVLYYQQGLRLWAASPFVGYGIGQFGGGVASQHDPEWYANPRFGPEGFDMHGFEATQVDSFWLHLLVETGVIGSAAYIVWLATLAVPAIGRSRRRDSSDRTRPGSTELKEREDVTIESGLDRFVPAALTFAVVIAGLSPSLEDPVFAPLLFAGIGLSWAVQDRRQDRSANPGTVPAAE